MPPKHPTNMVIPKDPKPVWVACRATPGCEGKQAVVVFTRNTNSIADLSGTTTRYRCLKCNRPFHITR